MSREPRPEPAPVRAVIAGCGRIAGGFNDADERLAVTHAAAYRRLGVKLAGCCDVELSRAKAFAARWGIERVGRSLEEVAPKEGPVVFSVCTPASAQAELLKTAAAHPQIAAVLLEKPLGASLDDALEIARLAKTWGRPVIVNYFRGFTPFYRELDRFVRSGPRGALRHVTVSYSGTPESQAGHALERLVAMLGPSAAVERQGGAADAPLFVLEWSGGRRAHFVPLGPLDYSVFELDLFFERGRLRVVDSERRAESFEPSADPVFTGYTVLAPAAPFAQALSHEIVGAVEAAVRAAETSQDDGTSLARALEVARILDRLAAAP